MKIKKSKNYKDISLECFEKSKANKKLLPLSSVKNYIIIYNELSMPQKKPNFDRSPSHIRHSNNNNNATTNSPQSNAEKTKANLSNAQTTSGNTVGSNNNSNGSQQALGHQSAKSAEIALTKSKADLAQQQRNALSSSLLNAKQKTSKSPSDYLPRASDFSKLAELSSKMSKNQAAAALSGSSLTASTTNSISGYKTPLKTNLANLSLKPATVEVYFRNQSGKTSGKALERKSIPTTIFPPPKIGLKS